MTLDLPQPFGPTIAVISSTKGMLVGSTKDLNPASFIFFKRMNKKVIPVLSLFWETVEM
jgi:hypothetical protein